MILNKLEKFMMNGPVRGWIQRHVDVPRFLALGGETPGARVLEMGCGNGRGMGLILEHFHPARVDGFDLDPEMVALARRRLAGDPRTSLWVGDATALPVADGVYDAVFDFGIIHHVPRWRQAVAQGWRVLRPGGRFHLFEVYAPFIHHPVWRRLLDHPRDERFDHAGLGQALMEQGFDIVGETCRGDQFGWYVARRP